MLKLCLILLVSPVVLLELFLKKLHIILVLQLLIPDPLFMLLLRCCHLLGGSFSFFIQPVLQLFSLKLIKVAKLLKSLLTFELNLS
jgi:hypothetical protein